MVDLSYKLSSCIYLEVSKGSNIPCIALCICILHLSLFCKSVSCWGGSKSSVTKGRFSTFQRSCELLLISFRIVWSFQKCTSSSKNIKRSMRYEAFCFKFYKTLKSGISTLCAAFRIFNSQLGQLFRLVCVPKRFV